MLLGLGEESRLHGDERGVEVAEHVAEIEALVKRDLVVARASGMELAAHRAGDLDEAALDVHVDVFELAPEGEAPALELGPHRLEPPSMAARSVASISPARSRARAHAALPRMSCGQSRRSKESEEVKASAVGSASALKRPPHGLPDPGLSPAPVTKRRLLRAGFRRDGRHAAAPRCAP